MCQFSSVYFPFQGIPLIYIYVGKFLCKNKISNMTQGFVQCKGNTIKVTKLLEYPNLNVYYGCGWNTSSVQSTSFG